MIEDILPTAEELEIIRANVGADVRSLALALRPQANVRNDFVLRQISGRQALAGKVPEWTAVDGVVFPRSVSVEQCSSAETARYKAGLVSGASLVDITGGFGVDFYYMSARFDAATHVEADAELSAIVRHNMPLLGNGKANVVCADGTDFLRSMTEKVSCIYLDPSRRDAHGRKVVHLSDCTPNVVELEPLLLQKADTVLVKLSPMLDISEALSQLSGVQSVNVVSVGNECKELLLVLGKAQNCVQLVACNITRCGNELFVTDVDAERTAQCRFARRPLGYLYEPNASIMKAGAFKTVASRFDVEKLHTSSHLYTSDALLTDFPGRRFRIESWATFGRKEMAGLLSGIDRANVSVRNFPLTAEAVRTKFKLKDGGDKYLFASTLADGTKIAMLCAKV